MSIAQRGTSLQAYVQVNGQRARKTFTNHSDASLWEAQARHNLQRGLLPPMHINSDTGVSSLWTLGKSLDEAHETLWEGGKNDYNMLCTIKLLNKYHDEEAG